MKILNQPVMGIEIGGTKLQVVAGTSGAGILQSVRKTVNRARGAQGIREGIEEAWHILKTNHPLAAVGLGFGGPIDHLSGEVAMSYHVDGWHDFNIMHWLETLTGLPVFVDNDTNAAALAEARLGAGKNADFVFYTNMGSGMGGGMVLHKKLYHGARPGEAELGQTLFDQSGATFESRCSGWAIDRKIREATRKNPQSILARLVGPATAGEARYLGDALQQGCPDAQALFNVWTDDLAFALSHATHLFHPEVVVIGGGLSLMGEPLRRAVAAKLPGFLTAALKPGPQVWLSALGEEVVCIGAFLLAEDGLQNREI